MTATMHSQVLDLDGDQPLNVPSSSSNNGAPLFTCLSCSIGYPNPEDQRAHYRTDLHRYNMKRRVANLPPIRADVFDAKILQQKGDEEKKAGAKDDRCQVCQKSFSSSNAYQSHVASKKHKENESRLRKMASSAVSAADEDENDPLVVKLPAASGLDSVSELQASLSDAADEKQVRPTKVPVADLRVAEDATEEEIQAAIDAKVATTKRIDPETSCLFCSNTSFTSLDESLDHMTRQHGFFVPEQTYLVDRTGLLKYLADKICIGNMCLYCNGRGRGFLSGEAARKHMIDKSHCKVAYETEEDRLELSDFYDFTSSYPDAQWEDLSDEDGEGMDDIVEEGETDDDDLPDDSNQVRYGDNEFELVLPSGVRLGHRSLRRYYNQSLRPTGSAYTSGSQVAHRLNASAEKKDELAVQGRGGNVVRARNRGEAREAKKHISTYRDSNKREQYKTQIGYRNNSQKHFRDPLLQ
jgi:pre-60S factor REI1